MLEYEGSKTNAACKHRYFMKEPTQYCLNKLNFYFKVLFNMNVKWISLNPRLKEGISLINNIPTKKFQLLLTHLVNASKNEPFTEDETKRLEDSLKLSRNNVTLLIQSIVYLLKQYLKAILKPTDLQNQLVEDLGFDTEKAEEFTKIWSEETKKDVGDYAERFKLDDLAWEENLTVSSQICKTQKVSSARIQFKMSRASDGSKKDLTVELDKDELTQLYNTLETVQLKLDNLQKD